MTKNAADNGEQIRLFPKKKYARKSRPGNHTPRKDRVNTPKQLIANKKNSITNSEIARAKIAAGVFVSNSLKYDEETIILHVTDMINWFVSNADKVFIEEYYTDPDTLKIIPWGSYKVTYGRHESCDQLHAAMKKILEIRLAKNALTKVYDGSFAKFLMINNHGYSDKVDHDVTVNAKKIKFKFGNTELSKDNDE